ncbi:MAG: hypothetical protein HIU82_00950 [Proteobacteria bacterium]|nr:hypothetical protein [Pseudomonadota bacterium]
MAAAMAQIRAELGPDALILSSRQVAEGVEVTAAIDPADEPPPLAARPHLAHPAMAPPTVASPTWATPTLVATGEPDRAAMLAWHGVPPTLRTALGTGALETALAAALRFAPLALGSDAAPLLLVGPPGAGKTLAVARLATRLVLAGAKPRVITADGQRAGAAEQLAAFTRLLGLDLVAAATPAGLVRALARTQDGGPVLIDAPGLDAFDADQRALLAELIAIAGGDTALVLPAGLDTAEAEEQAQAHAEAGARTMIATRLDLARRLGGVLAAAGVLALAEAGIGPGAADGLVPLTPALLAARLRCGRPARSPPAIRAPTGNQPNGHPPVGHPPTRHQPAGHHVAGDAPDFGAPATDSAPFLPPFPAPARTRVAAPSRPPDTPPAGATPPPHPSGMAAPSQRPLHPADTSPRPVPIAAPRPTTQGWTADAPRFSPGSRA